MRSSCRTGGGFRMAKTRRSIKPAKRVFQEIGMPRKLISWPATSSITTNCGSFRPDARDTRVAAGIPMSTAMRTRTLAAAGCEVAEIECATMAQRRTVAAEPQLPGPGRRRPTPKKVAITVAQSGAGAVTLAAMLPLLISRPDVLLPVVITLGLGGPCSAGVSPSTQLTHSRRVLLLHPLKQRHWCHATGRRSHIRHSPTYPDQSGGNARCRRETPSPNSSPAFCKSGEADGTLAGH